MLSNLPFFWNSNLKNVSSEDSVNYEWLTEMEIQEDGDSEWRDALSFGHTLTWKHKPKKGIGKYNFIGSHDLGWTQWTKLYRVCLQLCLQAAW